MSPGNTDAEPKHAARKHIIHPTPSIRDNDLSPYVEHEMPAMDNDAEYESLQERKSQLGKVSTDLYHITSRDIVSQNATSILTLEKDLLSPATDEDCYSSSQSQIRQFRKLNTFLGIDSDCPPSKPAEYMPPETGREASGDCEMFDFEMDEPNSQDNFSTAMFELECTSISNILEAPGRSGDVPQILRPGTPLPIELGNGEAMSQGVIMEETETFSPPKNTPNELFLTFHESPRILWSHSQRQKSKLSGYIASIRERHCIPYKTYKKPESRPNLVPECPKEITLTIPTPTSSPVENLSQFVDQSLLMPPPRLYKKKSRHQKIIADSINVKELRVRRLSHMDISDEEFVARKHSIMQEVIIVFGD